MGAHTFRNDLFEGYKANRPAPRQNFYPSLIWQEMYLNSLAGKTTEWLVWKQMI